MLSIPPIYENLSLRDYDAGMDDLFARVWLNPSLDIVRKRGEMVRRTLDVIKSTDMEADDKLRALDELRPLRHEWLVAVLGHGPDEERRWKPDLNEVNGSYEAVPDFIIWRTERVSTLLDAHRDREKKS